ncbi:unnamed protein product [Lota lota]
MPSSVTESKTEIFNVDDGVDGGEKAPAQNRMQVRFERYLQPCLAELFGTTLFVFVGCASVIGNQGVEGAVQPALAHGLALGVLIAVLGEISGGHFNPAVSLSLYLCGGMELPLLGPYVVVQMLGGMIGAGLAKLMTPSDRYLNATGAAFDILKTEQQLPGAIFGEMAMTCLITMVVLLVAVNTKTKTPLAPFLVGCTVIINVLAGGDVSGTCLNPARAFGPAVMTNYWTYHWVYWVGPIGGCLFAAALLRLILGDEKMRVILK